MKSQFDSFGHILQDLRMNRFERRTFLLEERKTSFRLREVEVTAAAELTSWDGFIKAAARYGVPDVCPIRDVTSEEAAARPPRALVST